MDVATCSLFTCNYLQCLFGFVAHLWLDLIRNILEKKKSQWNVMWVPSKDEQVGKAEIIMKWGFPLRESVIKHARIF